jgi:site-specific DNA-methyltransferase (adenine-specific)
MKHLINKITIADCLGQNGLSQITTKSVDLILCDPPYQTTKLSWDIALDFDKLWKEYERIIKDNGAIILFSAQPFTSKLVLSNPKLFRYEIIWEKLHSTNFANAKKMPLKNHENILVFYKHLPTYNPQGLKDCRIKCRNKVRKRESSQASVSSMKEYIRTKTGYPKSVWKFKRDYDTWHPTQKPFGLIQNLIRTYSNPNDLIVDNCAGSGQTLLAALEEKRNCIAFEKNKEIAEKAIDRIEFYKSENKKAI